jgi:hypothetical protein
MDGTFENWWSVCRILLQGAGHLRLARAVVIVVRVPDPAQRLRRRQVAVERQPAHGADQAQQFDDAMARFG